MDALITALLVVALFVLLGSGVWIGLTLMGVAWIGMEHFGMNYWLALVVSPLVVGALGLVIERTLLKQLYRIDPIYGLLLTFGLALIAEGVFRDRFAAWHGVASVLYLAECALGVVLVLLQPSAAR